jgi:Ca-activated chloride channel family protein
MPEPSSTSRVGLFTQQGASVPLSGIDVRADVSGFCARVTLAQRYVNREASPIEAVYVFPLDEAAAVCGFEAVIDGTLVVGEVKERDQAFEMYDDAMMRGDGALLLDEERPDVFVASVGNLPPGKELLLKIVYVTELHVDDDGLRFVLPTTVSPRYAPAVDRIGVGRPDAETLNPPVAWKVPYGLNLVVELSLPDVLSRVESPSHPIQIALNGQRATVSLSQKESALDRDFVLVVGVPNIDTPRAWIERDEGNEAAAIGFYPRLDDRSVPSEVIFLVDRSGSMGGSSIGEVRNALQLCLRSMIPGCRFNIIGFGTSFQPLFPESRAYDDASLAAASAHVAGLQADMGGTEILPALTYALESPRHESLHRQVIVLTDGEVTNTDAVLALASKHAHHARVFTFGIGAGASHHLVRGLARAGKGAAEFIYPGERIESKVVRQFGRLLSPALADVRVDWGGLPVTQAPTVVPPVFAGSRLVLYAFVTRARAATIRLTASSPAGPVAFEVPLDPGHAQAGRTIATLAARARIRELEETPEWARQRGSQQKRGTSSASREIIALSTRYNLMSRETSFVAIERRETPVLGDVQLRRVPIALTNGWGSVEHDAPFAAQMIGSASLSDTGSFLFNQLDQDDVVYRSMPSAPLPSPTRSAFSAGMDFVRESIGGFARRQPSGGTPAAPRSTTRATGSAPERQRMHTLISLQRADGSFDLTTELAAVLGYDLATLEGALPPCAGRDRDEARVAWATALAIAWLRERANTLESEWRTLAKKARTRLDAWLGPNDGSRWIVLAAKFWLAHPGTIPDVAPSTTG